MGDDDYGVDMGMSGDHHHQGGVIVPEIGYYITWMNVNFITFKNIEHFNSLQRSDYNGVNIYIHNNIIKIMSLSFMCKMCIV